MKIDLTWKKVSGAIIGLVAICGAVWQIFVAVHKVGNFIDKVYELENRINQMYTSQEVQFLIKYKSLTK